MCFIGLCKLYGCFSTQSFGHLPKRIIPTLVMWLNNWCNQQGWSLRVGIDGEELIPFDLGQPHLSLPPFINWWWNYSRSLRRGNISCLEDIYDPRAQVLNLLPDKLSRRRWNLSLQTLFETVTPIVKDFLSQKLDLPHARGPWTSVDFPFLMRFRFPGPRAESHCQILQSTPRVYVLLLDDSHFSLR